MISGVFYSNGKLTDTVTDGEQTSDGEGLWMAGERGSICSTKRAAYRRSLW